MDILREMDHQRMMSLINAWTFLKDYEESKRHSKKT